MRVAVIGAGLAGLACAHELLRNGIIPDIFEDDDYIGEKLDFPVIDIKLFNSPIREPFKYLKKKYEINISPHYDLNEFTVITPTKSYKIQGKLGHILRRGIHHNALAYQILRDIEIPIKFNTPVNFEDIKDSYDHVVVSTGNFLAAAKLQVLKPSFDAFVRVATIKGDFKTDAVNLWLNTRYARHGFAYFVPDSEFEGNLILIVSNASYEEFEYFWSLFISENNHYEITSQKDLRHTVGIVDPVKIGNIYLTGNAGGFIDSFVGFGAAQGMISGASAGYCIAHNIDYQQFVKKGIKANQKKYEFRKAFDKLDNEAIERATRIVTLPGIKHAIYNNPLARITQGAPLAKLYNKVNDYKFNHKRS